MCIDDISWGTKGEVGGKSLGEAKLREDGTFDVSVPISKEQINQSYLDQLEKLEIQHLQKRKYLLLIPKIITLS